MDDYNDETSQVNALISGQLQAIDQLSAASIRTLTSGSQVVVVSNGQSL